MLATVVVVLAGVMGVGQLSNVLRCAAQHQVLVRLG
jgi:hypothetical protein